MSIQTVWGAFLQGQGGADVDTINLKNSKVIGLYFGAYWSKPCMIFLPVLMNFYKQINGVSKTKRFEVIYVHHQRNLQDFTKVVQGCEWLYYSYKDMRLHQIKYKYKTKVLPKLIIVNQAGEVITQFGREQIIKYGGLAFQQWAVTPPIKDY